MNAIGGINNAGYSVPARNGPNTPGSPLALKQSAEESPQIAEKEDTRGNDVKNNQADMPEIERSVKDEVKTNAMQASMLTPTAMSVSGDAMPVQAQNEYYDDLVVTASGAKESKSANNEIRKAIEELNKKMLANHEAIFGIHEDTNRVTIKIVDKENKKVIKEIPPEKTLDMIAKLWEAAGILVDEKK